MGASWPVGAASLVAGQDRMAVRPARWRQLYDTASNEGGWAVGWAINLAWPQRIKAIWSTAAASLALLDVSPAAAQIHVVPLPAGDPLIIAGAAIKTAGHPPPRVSGARRMPDGSIAAVCSNHQLYLMFRARGAAGIFALRSSAAKRLLNASCLRP